FVIHLVKGNPVQNLSKGYKRYVHLFCYFSTVWSQHFRKIIFKGPMLPMVRYIVVSTFIRGLMMDKKKEVKIIKSKVLE
ncbi:MAG TPA: hypothetical protein VER14_04325, partial [Phototrophicaceae bacterium]|nr:hypothetical protein [Phototrophicaceae bacterium]